MCSYQLQQQQELCRDIFFMLFIFIAQLHHIVAAVVSEPAADQLAQAVVTVVAVVAAQEKRSCDFRNTCLRASAVLCDLRTKWFQKG